MKQPHRSLTTALAFAACAGLVALAVVRELVIPAEPLDAAAPQAPATVPQTPPAPPKPEAPAKPTNPLVGKWKLVDVKIPGQSKETQQILQQLALQLEFDDSTVLLTLTMPGGDKPESVRRPYALGRNDDGTFDLRVAAQDDDQLPDETMRVELKGDVLTFTAKNETNVVLVFEAVDRGAK